MSEHKKDFENFFRICTSINTTLFQLGFARTESLFYPEVSQINFDLVSKNFELKKDILEQEVKRLWAYNFCDSMGYIPAKHLEYFLLENKIDFNPAWMSLVKREHFIVIYEQTAVALFRSLNYYKGYFPPSVLDYFMYPIDDLVTRPEVDRISFIQEFSKAFYCKDNQVIPSLSQKHIIKSELRDAVAEADIKLDFMVPLTHKKLGKLVVFLFDIDIH